MTKGRLQILDLRFAIGDLGNCGLQILDLRFAILDLRSTMGKGRSTISDLQS